MSKAILLSRVSTEIQTLEQQTNELIKEANNLGYDEKHRIIIEDIESAISLDEQERRGLNKMKECIENDSEVNCVICYEVSRISRRPKVLYSIRDYLLERKIQLVILTPYMRLLDNNGNMSQTASILFSLFSSLSESEMIIKKQRMRRGKLQAMKNGKYGGGWVAFGYTFINNQLAIDEKNAEVVKKIFNMYLNGYSMKKIAIELLETGELPYKTKECANSVIKKILSNKAYYGENENSAYIYPPIISKEIFDKCRQKAKENTHGPKSIVSMVYYCRGLLRCRLDNRLLTPSKASRVYALHTLHDNDICVSINVMDSLMWQVVSEWIVFHAPEDNDKMKDELKEQIQTLKNKIVTSKQNKKELEIQLDRIEKRIIEGKLNESRGDRMEKEIDKQIKDIKDKQNKWQNEIHNKEYELKQLEDNILYMTKDLNTLTDEDRYNIIKKTIETMYIERTEKRGTYNIDFIFKNGIIKTFKVCSQSKYPKFYDEYGQDYHVNYMLRVSSLK